MKNTSCIFLFTTLQYVQYKFAWGAGDASFGSTLKNSAVPRPTIVLAKAVLSTIVPPEELLRSPGPLRKPNFGGGTDLLREKTEKAKRHNAFAIPDDPIKKAVGKATTSPLLFQSSTMRSPISSSLQFTRRLREESATTSSRNGTHSRGRMLRIQVEPVQDLHPVTEVKEYISPNGGTNEDSAQTLEKFAQVANFAQYQAMLTPVRTVEKEELIVADVPASGDIEDTAGTSLHVCDDRVARSHIINFAREVGRRYGDPEKYGNCAAEFVDQFLSPAGLTVELARLMMEIDARDRPVAGWTSHDQRYGATVQSPDITTSLWRLSQIDRNTDEEAHVSSGFTSFQSKSYRRQGIPTLPPSSETSLLQSAAFLNNVPSPWTAARDGHQTGVMNHDSTPGISKLEVESPFVGEMISSTLDVRLKKAIATVVRSLNHQAAQFQPIITQEEKEEMLSDSRLRLLSEVSARTDLSEETARHIIISFAGEIGNQKGAPEEHVRLAEALVDRYLKPAGWTQYIAEMIMEARREAEHPNFKIADGLLEKHSMISSPARRGQASKRLAWTQKQTQL